MSSYPPKLVCICSAPFGSLLSLDDGTHVAIDVRPDRLDALLRDNGHEHLHTLIESQCLGVFAGHLSMTNGDWDKIGACVRSSTDAARILSRFPLLWASFWEPYQNIVRKVHRLYGGLSRCLYTSYPVDFRCDPNRPPPWFRALLNAPSGWLFQTWVHLGTRKVEVEQQRAPGHFVE